MSSRIDGNDADDKTYGVDEIISEKNGEICLQVLTFG